MRAGQLFPRYNQPGCFQMALDRALTTTPLFKPLLRFYTWHPWTLSLGFHQKIDNSLLQRAEQADIPVVRRDTGGRAVLHAEELTYSFILPVTDPLAEAGLLPLYHNINCALLKGFTALGVAGTQASEPTNLRQHYRSAASDICFSSSVQSEIVFGGRKLVGSAQRRFSRTVLQHGSILLGQAHERIVDLLFEEQEREAALQVIRSRSISLGEIVEEPPDLQQLCSALTGGFATQFELQFEETLPAPELLTQVESQRAAFRLTS